MIDMRAIELELQQLTKNHKPELNPAYMEAAGRKLSNNDTDTAKVTLFTEQSAEEAYRFMRATFGDNPLAVKSL